MRAHGLLVRIGLLFGLGLLVIAGVPIAAMDCARAQAASALTEADQSAIRQVIQDQMAAFGKDDADKAFGYAAPAIHEIFRTSENFMNMVRSGYAPVYRPRKVEFGPIEMIDGVPVQHVFVVGPDGDNVDALYYMQRQPDGTWKVNGCELKASYQA